MVSGVKIMSVVADVLADMNVNICAGTDPMMYGPSTNVMTAAPALATMTATTTHATTATATSAIITLSAKEAIAFTDWIPQGW